MNKNYKIKNLIAALMLMPLISLLIIIILINVLEYLPHVNMGDSMYTVLIPICVYIPVIISLVLSNIFYKKSISKILVISNLILICISIYYYYNTFFKENSGWDGLGYFICWALFTIILSITSFVFFLYFYWKNIRGTK